METTYLGHDAKYWLELQKRADELGVINYIQEISNLKGQLAFTKSRIEEINKILNP